MTTERPGRTYIDPLKRPKDILKLECYYTNADTPGKTCTTSQIIRIKEDREYMGMSHYQMNRKDPIPI